MNSDAARELLISHFDASARQVHMNRLMKVTAWSAAFEGMRRFASGLTAVTWDLLTCIAGSILVAISGTELRLETLYSARRRISFGYHCTFNIAWIS